MAPDLIRQAVGGGCQSGCGWLPSFTNAIEADTWPQGEVAGHDLGAMKGGGRGEGLPIPPWGGGGGSGA